MAKILNVNVQKPATATIEEDYFILDIDKQAPVMERVLTERLGIELGQGAVRSELKTLYAKAANDGITKGRLTAKLPKGWKLRDTISVFDSEGLRPNGVGKTIIEDGLTSGIVGYVICAGELDGDGKLGEVEFRILPCAEGYEARMCNGHRLEPVGLFYSKNQSEQKKLFAEYQKEHNTLSVEYATPMEIVISALMDRECHMPPKSGDHTFNSGYYRIVPGGVGRRLCMCSDYGRLRLEWYDSLGALARYSVAASVGVRN